MPKGEVGGRNLDVQLVRAGDRSVGFKSVSSKDRVQIFFEYGAPSLWCAICEEVLVWQQPCWKCSGCQYSVTSGEALEIVGKSEIRLKELRDVIGRSSGKGNGRWSLAKLFGR